MLVTLNVITDVRNDHRQDQFEDSISRLYHFVDDENIENESSCSDGSQLSMLQSTIDAFDPTAKTESVSKMWVLLAVIYLLEGFTMFWFDEAEL